MTALVEQVPDVAVRPWARVAVLVGGLGVGLAGAELVQAQLVTRGLPEQVRVQYVLAVAGYLMVGLAGLAALHRSGARSLVAALPGFVAVVGVGVTAQLTTYAFHRQTVGSAATALAALVVTTLLVGFPSVLTHPAARATANHPPSLPGRLTLALAGTGATWLGLSLIRMADHVARGLNGTRSRVTTLDLVELAVAAALLALTLAPAGLRLADGASALGAAVAAEASLLVVLYLLAGNPSSTTLEYAAMAVGGLVVAALAGRQRDPGRA